MKHFMLRSLMLLSLLCTTLGVNSVWAQLTAFEVGKVYHFTNANYTEKAMGATNPRSVAGVAANINNKAQLWYVESQNEHSYALRNLGFGTYLQANGQSSRWTLASTTESNNSWITLEKVGSNNAFKGYTYSNYGYAHIDGSSNVVGWTNSATSTQWTITKIDMDESEIQEALNIFTSVSTIQENLDKLFSDKSCTTLKDEFDENDASFNALPPTLQAMVRKVAGNTSWDEANSDNSKAKWDADYAKKYRIQMYEPYCDPEKASAALALNQHSNMNNPTGLFANSRDVIYVMVEGEIKEGATLYLSYYTQHGKLGSATDGYELKQGLNVLPIYQDECNLYINYVVETFEKSDNTRGHLAKKRKLSQFPALKIHIEGGHINGYYNKMGDDLYSPDKNADWEYLEARAPQKDLVILGQYMTLNFPLNDADTEGNKGMRHYLNDLVKVEDVINAWDNVMLWERMLLGVAGKKAVDEHSPKSPYSKSDHDEHSPKSPYSMSNHVIAYTGEDDTFPTGYDDYYNIHGLAQGVGGNTYMYGSGDHSGYHYNTMGGIIQNMPTNAGSHWGPAHEIGHQHQNLINMRGEMEVSNNLFSNVVLWMYGETTSRVNGTEGSLENILKNFNKESGHYLNNSIWGMTQMYYKLFLYYHVLGHNPKFYPRLFEMLRQDPQKNNRAKQVDGANAQLHLYKKMCAAAEEDLTEFFRAHGFFKPLNNWSVDDYGVSTYNMTQSQIDEAIAEVKSNEWKENIAVLFINDATGETIKSHKGDNLELYGETTVCADLGGYGNFNTNEPADYTYNISGTTITMDGTGGVGFAILNEKGELIGFSNKKKFEVSAAAAEALASGRASVVTLNADNSSVVATNIMESGDNETKHNLLGSLLDEVKATLALSDETGTKVGFYRENALTALNTIYTKAKSVHDEKTVSAYTPVYDELYREYANLLNNEYARINITEGYAYRLTNKAYPTLSMGVKTAKGDDENEMLGLPTANNDAQLWYFEPGTTAGTYYLKNKGTKLYPAGASTGAVLKADKAESTKGQNGGAAPYTLNDMGNGVFALSNGTGLHCSESQSYNIVGWGTDADATQWHITAVELDNALEARLKLEETIEKTMSLINEMASAIPPQNFKLQTEDSKAAYYLSTNACYNTLSGKTDGQGLAGLLDDKTSTYFHSDYSGNAEGTHYLQVDLGEGNAVGHFHFSYTIRDTNKNYPEEIKVEGSTNGIDFNELLTLTQATHNLPTNINDKWESPLIENPEHYRYLRFSVTKAWGGNVYFVMSGFGIRNPEPIVNEVYSEFANDDDSKEALKTQIIAALNEITEAQQLVDEASADEETYNTQRVDLNDHYNTLLTAYNSVKNAALNAKKEKLQTLIEKTNELIGECGEVTYTPAMFDGEAPLQVTEANGKFYLSTNAQSKQEGPISGLIDGILEGSNKSGYFHSDYSGSDSNDGLDHYIQVNLGESVKLFKFTYTNRHDTDGNYATKMTILGSTDGENFEEVTRLEGLPASKSAVYNSEEINATKEYTYLRFMVTESTSTKKGEHYFFHMAEFDLIIGKPESYTVQINQNIGEVTEDLLLATYKENEEAKSTFNYATTELQVINAIANLQAQYEALKAAKNVVDKKPLIQLIATATEKLAACGTVTPNGKELDVEFKEETAGSVNKNMLRDLYRAIETAEGVRDNANATQEEVNAAINAMTAQIEVIQVAQQNPAKANLKQEIADMETLLTECATNPGSASKQLIADCQTALQIAKNVYDADNTTVDEYAEAKTVLHENFYTKLSNAKNSPAKAELNTAITAMETLLDDCKDNSDSGIQELIADCQTALHTAKDVYDADDTTVEGYSQATTKLTKLYTELSVAKAKAELRAEISKLEELINKCLITGTTIVTKEENCDLQATSPDAAFYISTNAQTNESGIANLVDGDMNSSFQTKSGVGDAHYLLVDAGADKTFKKFKFSYQTCNNPLPYAIEVYGRNDNADFKKLAIFTKDDAQNPLPSSTNQDWTSSEIGNGTAYRYLRFNVTKSGVVLKINDNKEIITDEGQQLSNKYKNALSATDAATSQSEYCFAMSEFDLTNIVDEEQPTEILAGTVTEAQRSEATTAKYDAQKLVDESANQADLSAKTAELQEIYETLYAAYGIQVSLATTVEGRDKLLSNIEFGKTIGTFSAPYATVIPEGVTAYYAEQEYDRGTVSLTPIEDATALPANQGVILIGNLKNVTFYPATDETPADLSANTFSHSATSSVVMKSNDYILANPNGGEGIGFYQAEEGTTLKQGKAFFRLSAGEAPLSLVLKFGGNTTDIDAVTTGTPSDNELIYDIYGRRVTEVQKGNIYIKNGKKFFVK